DRTVVAARPAVGRNRGADHRGEARAVERPIRVVLVVAGQEIDHRDWDRLAEGPIRELDRLEERRERVRLEIDQDLDLELDHLAEARLERHPAEELPAAPRRTSRTCSRADWQCRIGGNGPFED